VDPIEPTLGVDLHGSGGPLEAVAKLGIGAHP
jgi:hypothetical protein